MADLVVDFDGAHQAGRYVNLRGSQRPGTNSRTAFLRQRAAERGKRENDRKRNTASTCIQVSCWKKLFEGQII